MLFFEQIAEGDKEFLALEAANIAVDRAVLAYETAVADRELRLRKADVRCFTEGGDVLDLMQYYAEAANQEKEQGLLQKAWDAIKNLFTRIRNTLFGCKNKELPSDVSLPQKIGKFLQDLPGQWQAVKSSITWKNLAAGAGAIATFVGFMEGGTKWLQAKAVEGKEKMEESASPDAGPIKKFSSTVITKALDIIIEALDILNKLAPDKKDENNGNNNDNGENNGNSEENKEKSGIPNPLTVLKDCFNRFSTWVHGIYNSLTGKKDDEKPEENGENPDDGKKDENGDGKEGEGKDGKGDGKVDENEGNPDDGKKDKNGDNKDGKGGTKENQDGNGQQANENEPEPEGTTHASNYQGDVKKQGSDKAKPVKVGGKGRKFRRTFNINNTIKAVREGAKKKGITDEDAIQRCVNAVTNCFNRNDQEGIANAIKKLGLEVVYEAGEGLYLGSDYEIFLEETKDDFSSDSFVESVADPDSIWNTYGLDSVFGNLI